MNKILLITILIITLFSGSCSKQSAPDIAGAETRSREEQQRLEACSNVNFQHEVLGYQNVILLFRCTKWDKDFPNLFASINAIRGDSWNHVFSPINDAFLEGQTRRDKTFKNIRELDNKNGLDDLSYVIVALNETNFFDSVKSMFKCVENPTDELCKDRKNIPLKKSLKNIIHLIDLNPEAIGELSQLSKKLNLALTPKQEELREQVNKFRTNKAFIEIRLQLIDAIASKIKAGLTEEDRKFVSTLLRVGDKNGDVPWIYSWLQDEGMNRDKFRGLMEFPIYSNPFFIQDMVGIKQMYDKGIRCTFAKDGNPNDQIVFDYKTSMNDYFSVVKNRTYKQFFDFSSMHVVGVKTTAEFCKEVVENEYKSNLLRAAVKAAEFFSERKYYDLVKFAFKYTTTKGDQDKSFAENFYFGDLWASNLYYVFNGMVAQISKDTRDFTPLVFDILKTLPPETLINLAGVIDEVTKIENDPKFVGVADFWNFFTPEEKNFVFNFIDRHFDPGIQFALLFDFYGKFLDDFQESQPIFKNAWTGSETKDELSYLALQDLFFNFSGKETLQDFKKFFSRDHIIKILEILSSGQRIAENAREELKYRDSTDYVNKSKKDKYVFEVKNDSRSDDNYNARPLIECLDKFADVKNGFYQMIRNLPQACTAVTNENISIRLYGWLNTIEKDYSKFKLPFEGQDSIFNDQGLLSPYMLNTHVGLMKIADNLLGPLNSTVPTKHGIEYLLDSFNYYLNQKAGILELEKQVDLLNDYLRIDEQKNIIYRNSLLKSYTENANFNYTRNFLVNVSDLIVDFGEWISSGKYKEATNRSLGTYDPKNSCSSLINQKISPYPCPSTKAIKEIGNHMLSRLATVWEPEMGSPLKHLMAGAKMGGGLDIPLYGKKTTKYKLSIGENIRYLYDTFDRSFKVNNEILNYVNPDNIEVKESVTTLERVETVIREVRFENNYLGAIYLNFVVEGDDYNKDVKARKKLMQTCLKIPGVRCGRKMSDSDLRMAKNALEAYDSLLDVNNGREKEEKLKYGNFLKAFQQTLIASSSRDAQELSLFPLKDEVLKRHNGVILGDISMLNGFSNTARFIKDRIGRSRKELDNFLEREDFKRVDRVLMNGFDLKQATPAAERIVKKLISTYPGQSSNLYENTVDWLSTLNYDELRLVEDTFARLMVVGSYLGTPDVVFNLNSNPTGFDQYKNNNLFQMFLAIEKVIDYWPNLKLFFPKDAKLIDAFKPLNNILYFFTEKLNSSKDPYNNKAYVALNDIFMVMQTVLFDDIKDERIIGRTAETYKGIDFVTKGLANNNLVSKTYNNIRTMFKFSDVFFENNGQFFKATGQNLKRLALSSKVDMTPLQDYLNFSSKNAVLVVGDSKGQPNYHYDEVMNLVGYLNKKDQNGETYLSIANRNIFKQNYNDIVELVNDLLPVLRIKAVKPPLVLN